MSIFINSLLHKTMYYYTQAFIIILFFEIQYERISINYVNYYGFQYAIYILYNRFRHDICMRTYTNNKLINDNKQY